jgi:hypothetical protein
MEANELKKKVGDYESLFIRESDEIARYGKTAYISSEHHKRISQIVHVTGEGNMSIFSYIDNVLAHHFEIFKEAITESYEKKRMKQLF